MASIAHIVPDWPAPQGVRAAFTLRTGGVSTAPFDSLNVGTHVGDAPSAVAENRARIRRALSLPSEPVWLEQVHGADVVFLDSGTPSEGAKADASVARTPGHVCAIQVADCMPVLFAARDGTAVGAAHAGWRGLSSGVLEATVRTLGVDPAHLVVWLGPAISQRNFEVGDEVRAAFVAHDAAGAAAFERNERGRWQCDLYLLARQRLERLGVHSVHGGGWCTYADRERFFSYRRDGRCGRMAALVWMDDAAPGAGAA